MLAGDVLEKSRGGGKNEDEEESTGRGRVD